MNYRVCGKRQNDTTWWRMQTDQAQQQCQHCASKLLFLVLMMAAAVVEGSVWWCEGRVCDEHRPLDAPPSAYLFQAVTVVYVLWATAP